MSISLIFDLDSQKTDQITGLQSIHLQPIQFYRRNFTDSDAANIRIGQRDTAQPGSEELRTGKAAFGKGDLLETTLRKGSAGEVAAGEAHDCAKPAYSARQRSAATCCSDASESEAPERRQSMKRTRKRPAPVRSATERSQLRKTTSAKWACRHTTPERRHPVKLQPVTARWSQASPEMSPPRKARPETSSSRARRSGVSTGKAVPESCGSAILISGFIRYRPTCNPPRGASKD